MNIGYCRTISFAQVGEDTIHEYGIDLVEYKDCTYTVLDSAPALTRDFHKISRYVDLMNWLELSPVHFQDVARDISCEDHRDWSWDCASFPSL